MMKSIYQKLISNLNFPIEKLRTSLARALRPGQKGQYWSISCTDRHSKRWPSAHVFCLDSFPRLCPESPEMPQQGDCLHPRLQSLLYFFMTLSSCLAKVVASWVQQVDFPEIVSCYLEK